MHSLVDFSNSLHTILKNFKWVHLNRLPLSLSFVSLTVVRSCTFQRLNQNKAGWLKSFQSSIYSFSFVAKCVLAKLLPADLVSSEGLIFLLFGVTWRVEQRRYLEQHLRFDSCLDYGCVCCMSSIIWSNFNMNNKFVSETELDARRQKRQEEWEKTRRPDQPLGKDGRPYFSYKIHSIKLIVSQRHRKRNMIQDHFLSDYKQTKWNSRKNMMKRSV